MFLVSIVITSIVGLLYARQYFQFEKDFLTNIALRTFVVDANYSENRIGRLNQEDVEQISRLLKRSILTRSSASFPYIEIQQLVYLADMLGYMASTQSTVLSSGSKTWRTMFFTPSAICRIQYPLKYLWLKLRKMGLKRAKIIQNQ